MSLTAQQEFFARLVAEGKSQSEAYRQAYPKAQKWKPGNVWRRSSELSAKPVVLGRIEAIRAELRERTLWSMEQSVSVLSEIAQGGEKDADRVRAVAELNAMFGFEAPKKAEISGKGGGPVQTVSMTPDEFRAIAAEVAGRI